MENFYSTERGTQMLVALMKAHGVRKIIASPGTTNINIVACFQYDSYFQVYSSVDERSAAYMACGLAAESGEPVALSCTGATASRNYVPGLTEAYYRKLPVLAITSTQHIGRIGNNIPQVIDRSTQMKDLVKCSVQIPTIHDAEDEWAYSIQLNKALLELRHHGGGPVHINLATVYNLDYSAKKLPEVQTIKRIGKFDNWPELEHKRIGVVVGAHIKWNYELTYAVDRFCEIYGAVILCDHTSNYQGEYGVLAPLVCSQNHYSSPCSQMDILIDIGDISGAYMSFKPRQVWRVNPDGEIRDTYRKLRYVFEMEEIDFFEKYVNVENISVCDNSFSVEWKQEYKKILKKMPELPFSNAWIAQNTAAHLPENAVLHLGILNTLRTWNFFEMPLSVLGYANTGGFGIDGNISTLIGASLENQDKLYFGVVGDLAFFYDMNSLGNRHVGNNVRILLINNGRGTEFRNYSHNAERFGDAADAYMAAAGHYGNQSPELVKNYAMNLGFEYISAANKKDYLAVVNQFLNPALTEKPMLLEVFTDSKNESDALKIINEIELSATGIAKTIGKGILGDKGTKTLKRIIASGMGNSKE